MNDADNPPSSGVTSSGAASAEVERAEPGATPQGADPAASETAIPQTVVPETAAAGGRVAVRLLQGYLWHPASADLDLEQYLPRELDDAYVLWDPVAPPFAFFENGEPTASQTFFQFTVLQVYDERPAAEALHGDARHVSEALNPMLDATPDGVGWQLWEDLREL